MAIVLKKMMINPRIIVVPYIRTNPFPESSDMGLLLQVAVDLVISSRDSQEKQTFESSGSFQFRSTRFH